MAGYDDHASYGSTTSHPPAFNGEDYTFQKMKIKIFIKANGYKIWNIIEQGNFVPTKADKTPKIPS